MEWVVTGGTRQLKEVKDTLKYVPLVDTIQSLLQNSEICEEVSKSTKITY